MNQISTIALNNQLKYIFTIRVSPNFTVLTEPD